jgi:hypothetical protein
LILLVTTCRGRDPEYLGRLQRQIDESGWRGRKILISDGTPPTASTADWLVDATVQQEGQKKTYWRALALGLQECRRAGSDRPDADPRG